MTRNKITRYELDDDLYALIEAGGSGTSSNIYQNRINKSEEANAIGSYLLAKSVTWINRVYFVNTSTKTLTVTSTTGLNIGDTLILRNNTTFTELQVQVVSTTTNSVTVDIDTPLLVAGINFAYVLGGNRTNQYAEGFNTMSTGNSSHTEGDSTIARGSYSHVEGTYSVADGVASHAEGSSTQATGHYSHSEGNSSIASGASSHAEGTSTTAQGVSSHSEGSATKAIGSYSHAEGFKTTADGTSSHAEGSATIAQGNNSHAEGVLSQAIGDHSHAEGSGTIARGTYSHAEGSTTVADAIGSHAEGDNTTASGDYSHSQNARTIARTFAGTAMGYYNNDMIGTSNAFYTTADALVIGGGNSTTKSNAFRVTFDGKVYGKSAFNSSGADYAEYFEWLDRNFKNEDRVGYVVTLDGDKIRKARNSDDYILGIISVNPSVVGDSYDDEWQNKYITDEFGRIQYHHIDVEYEELLGIEENESDEELSSSIYQSKIRQDYVPQLNPNWDKKVQYIPRSIRAEWDAVGLVGKLLVRDDGTCQINSFAKVSDIDGVLTISSEHTKMRVIERTASNIVRVLLN
ncbi:peptidase G2 autoproteolytic cleavage domain-containing protein [Lysinibacillus sp. NPDC093712]|uniref:peptidase G2 autoproteolytic cleavage domain-containing protein n=1 Tax=Lysinibacillus sp. NPDC093712 TaxID=3390579 RepID=UPI003D041CB9